MGTHHASGAWHVAGDADEFIERWEDFLRWSKHDHPGLEEAILVRSVGDPQRFISLATWTTSDARAAWKESDGFQKRFTACRELCDEFTGGDYEQVVRV